MRSCVRKPRAKLDTALIDHSVVGDMSRALMRLTFTDAPIGTDVARSEFDA